MTVAQFNLRYPRRLKRLAGNAMTVILDGVTHRYGNKERNMRLTAYYETVDLRGKVEALRVIMDPIQTERSLDRILLAAFTLEEARKVRREWESPIYAGADVTVSGTQQPRANVGTPPYNTNTTYTQSPKG